MSSYFSGEILSDLGLGTSEYVLLFKDFQTWGLYKKNSQSYEHISEPESFIFSGKDKIGIVSRESISFLPLEFPGQLTEIKGNPSDLLSVSGTLSLFQTRVLSQGDYLNLFIVPLESELMTERLIGIPFSVPFDSQKKLTYEGCLTFESTGISLLVRARNNKLRPVLINSGIYSVKIGLKYAS